MPLTFTVHCFSLQTEGSASTSPMDEVCLSAVLICHQYCFSLLWMLSLSLLQDATITLSCSFLRVAGIQQNTISLLWYLVWLLLHCHFGKKWVYGLPAKTQQELLFLLSSCRQCGTSRLQSLSLLQRQDPAQQLLPWVWLHPSIPPTSSTPTANARWIQRCSFSFLLFLFPPWFLTLSAQAGADRCELTLPVLQANRTCASLCLGATELY